MKNSKFKTAIKTIIATSLTAGMFASASAADIVDTAVGAGQFKTLVAAIQAAGPGTVEALLKDKAKLAAILTYHVVPGKVMAKDVKAGQVKTAQGSMLTIKTDGGVMVDNAKVTATDVAADNGVIHIIDTVVLPKG
jgi:uncharacterized surface protein with fasciclin (FAS1) repeats